MNPKDQIKENLSIVDVVSTYVRLEKSGNQFKARCPFHNEKTPSFYVSPERKSFHCFGCQLHGDIFTFVEKIENIPFYESLKILADRAGVSLQDVEKNKEEGRLVALLKDATSHFRDNLLRSAESKQYLYDRGLTDETINTFQIGFAKNEWRDVFIFLASKGYSPEEMELAGLVIKTEKGYYDRFRGRIMFPIRNVSGATVGYSGRILPAFIDPTKESGKYVNTPETPLYHKSKILFGYDTAKKEMYETKEVVIVEGQMDLCMSYQSGVHNTVAVSGTAFTDEHIHLIKRFAERVILSFDTDSAGQNALRKSALLCLAGGLDVYVVGDFNSGTDSKNTKDPADLIMQNKELWFDAIKRKCHVIEFMVSEVMKSSTDEREQGRRIVVEVLPFVRSLQSSVDKSHFIKYISQKSGIAEESLREELIRGLSQIVDVMSEENTTTKNRISSKERIHKEIVAFARLKNFRDHEEIVSLAIDFNFFPEEIVSEEMFALEEKMIGDQEAYFKDLIKTYKKELHKEKLFDLQTKIRLPDANQEDLMRQISDLMKKGL